MADKEVSMPPESSNSVEEKTSSDVKPDGSGKDPSTPTSSSKRDGIKPDKLVAGSTSSQVIAISEEASVVLEGSEGEPEVAFEEDEDSADESSSGDTPVKVKAAAISKLQWAPADQISCLRVRSSNYMKRREKILSPGVFYECIAVDFVKSEKRLSSMARQVQLPDYNKTKSPDPNCHIPNLFVVTISIPVAPRSEDTFTMVTYHRLRPGIRELLASNSQSPILPGLRLFNEWCQKAPTDPKMQSRFKMIAYANNLGEVGGLHRFLSACNGKPFLIKRTGKTGFLHKDEDWMEMEISMHPLPFVMRKAISHAMKYVCSELRLTVGFTIEGRKPEELPECLLGVLQIHYPSPPQAVPFPPKAEAQKT